MDLAVGLMSGTSADGVTAALVGFSERSVKVLRHRTFPYPRGLRERVLGARELKAAELSRLNFELGEVFARAALRISRGLRPRVIGSHGQTLWHGPGENPPNTLQLAEPSVIAERSGACVVADFRPRDMAAGGQGAPLMPAFDEFLLSQGPLRAAQNIGGIANVSFAGLGRLWGAFDTGPGNCLMDLAVSLATKGRARMDKDGRLARRGRPDLGRLRLMLAHPYFRKAPPKSLDRNSFGEAFLRRHFRVTRKSLPNTLATLALFTARTIADSLSRFAPKARPLREVVVSGGGAKNPALMRHLRELLKPAPLVLSDRYGIPVMAKEAACFAWLAWRAARGEANNCPRATGASGRRIIGKIIPGRFHENSGKGQGEDEGLFPIRSGRLEGLR